MYPRALTSAAGARGGYWRGAVNELMASGLGRAWLLFGFGLSLVLASVSYLRREPLTGLYTNNALVHATSAALLGWIALYHIADATQVISIFLLRSWRITIAPMVLYPVMLWGIGVTGGYLLAYHGLLGWPAQAGADSLLYRHEA